MKIKSALFIFFITYSGSVFSQKKLPIVNAISKKAKIYEEGNTVSNWSIDPNTQLDIFTTNKLTRSKTIKFKTDTDSIIFQLKPGEVKDFIVLLNGKDSCVTRIKSPEIKNFSQVKPEIHDTIPLIINAQNTMYVKAVLNKTDTLNLNFDTGTTELVLIGNVLNTKIKSKPKLYNTPTELEIGKLTYTPKVYDAELTGHDTDGRFGWDLFDGMIVELNYDKNVMIVHSKLPKGIKADKGYTKLDVKYFNQVFMVESTLLQAAVEKKEWFLFDTGYQRTAMLDRDLLEKSGFPTEKMKVIKKVMMRGAVGNEVPVVTSSLEGLKIGRYTLKDVPAQLLTTNKPVRNADIHILGNEVLKRFNTFLDFQANVVYMKPNHLFDARYLEGNKVGS